MNEDGLRKGVGESDALSDVMVEIVGDSENPDFRKTMLKYIQCGLHPFIEYEGHAKPGLFTNSMISSVAQPRSVA